MLRFWKHVIAACRGCNLQGPHVSPSTQQEQLHLPLAFAWRVKPTTCTAHPARIDCTAQRTLQLVENALFHMGSPRKISVPASSGSIDCSCGGPEESCTKISFLGKGRIFRVALLQNTFPGPLPGRLPRVLSLTPPDRSMAFKLFGGP